MYDSPSDFLLEENRTRISESSETLGAEPVLIGYKSLSADGVQFSLCDETNGDKASEQASSTETVKLAEGEEGKKCTRDSKQRKSIDKAMLRNINRFQRKQGKGTIDIYWLFDDGGLTLLLPYILSKKSQWENCKLRVFVAGSKEIELDRDKRHMATLLSKFRIDYSTMTVIPDIMKKPAPEKKKEFDELIDEVRNKHRITDSELEEQKEKTYRHLRCRELLLQHSSDASLVVITLPMPKKALISAGLYMAWLDTLTRDMPPILLLRGNQDSVLTFYS